MSLTVVAKELAASRGMDEMQMFDMLREAFECIERVTLETGRCQVRGWGVFVRKDCAARTARNPLTGESVEVPAFQKIALKHSNLRRRSTTPRLKPGA